MDKEKNRYKSAYSNDDNSNDNEKELELGVGVGEGGRDRGEEEKERGNQSIHCQRMQINEIHYSLTKVANLKETCRS